MQRKLMSSKLISIIIPFYNREKALTKCIQSALDQEDVSTEIILIDDGSTDNSSQICDDFSSHYSNVKVIHQTNHGLSHARNVGLNNSSGDYIFFLDSDDCLITNTLSLLKNQLETVEADYVIGNFEQVNDSNESISSNTIPKSIKNQLLNQEAFWHYAENSKLYFLFVTVWGKLFKRKIWDSIRFPAVRYAEDEFVLPLIVSQCSKIYVSDCITYRQTLSESSLVRSPYNIYKLAVPESKLSAGEYLFSRGNYSFALKKLEYAIGDTCYAAACLRYKDASAEFKRLFALSRKLSFKLLPHVSFQKKLKLLLYSFFPKLFILLRYLNWKFFIKPKEKKHMS